MKALKKHCDCKWMLLYIERWLVAPMQTRDGEMIIRTKGVPQGSVLGPVLANLDLHYYMDKWLGIKYPRCSFERYMDDAIIHCRKRRGAMEVMKALERRLQECGLRMHPEKTKIVYCTDSNRRYNREYANNVSFDFLGFSATRTEHFKCKKFFDAMQLMTVGPSKPVCRYWLQTTMCG